MPTYCIMCGKQKQGLPVENDHVIEAIRWFKRNVTKDEQNNNLVVCKEDYTKYKKNRERYKFRQTIYMGLGVILLLLGLAVSPRLISLLLGLIVLLFLYLMSLMNYTPKLRIKSTDITSKNQAKKQA